VTATNVLLPTAGRTDTVRALRTRLRDRRALLGGAAVLFVGQALAGLAGPAVLGHIVDLVVDGRAATAITAPALLLACAAVVQGVFAGAGPAVAAHAAEPALAGLREDVVDRAFGVPLGDIERAGTGDLVSRVDGDVAAVSRALKEAFPEVLAAGLTIGLTVVGLAVLDWRLALAGLCAAPIQLHTLRWYLPRSNPLYGAERVAAGERGQQLIETLDGAQTVRSLGLGARHAELVSERSRGAVRLVVAATRLRTRFFARLNLAEVTGLTAILLTGFFLVRDDRVSIGAVTAAALYFQRLFDPLNTLLYLLDEAQAAVAALARLVGVAGLPPAPVATVDAAGADVRLASVTFGYDSGHEVLHDIDLHIAHGSTVAVVGASGAGKTTIAKLVAGIHTAGAGQVTIGDVAVDQLAHVDGRRPVVLVTQEVHVYAGTLADDLRLGAPGARDDQLLDALSVVGADWVHTLPDGIATTVGDVGHALTTTQAQQLALARLVLADPAVAVLDEATAEAGSAGARTLEASARAALRGRTALVVAHRLTQAAAADHVVLVDAGRVVEVGTHDELVAAGGSYADLWHAWSAERGANSPVTTDR